MRVALKRLAWTLLLVALLIAAGVLWPLADAPRPEQGRDRLIVNVRVIDVERGIASPPTSVLIRAGAIAAIGTDVLSNDVTVFDARGGYLTPGFWDMHVHSFQISPQLHLPLFVANGVTGVRDMMDCPGAGDTLIACVADKRRWTRAVEAGRLAGPRFIGVASFYFDRPDMSPGEAAQLAAAYKARRLDALKVYDRLSRPVYLGLAREARTRNMRLVGHLPKEVALDEAIAAGQSSFEHARLFVQQCFARVDDWRARRLDAMDPVRLAEAMVRQHDPNRCARSFAAMRKAGARYVPTLVTREEDARATDAGFTDDPRLAYLDPLSRWAYRDDLASTAARYPGERGRAALGRYFELSLRTTGQAHRAGVPVLVGTDTVIGGLRYHDEMSLLVRAGLSPAQVLRAATIDAARYAALDRRFGTVEVGKRADLVLLAANPVVDIANTRQIRAVFVDGRLYDRPRLNSLLDFVRDQASAPSNWLKILWGFAASSVRGEL